MNKNNWEEISKKAHLRALEKSKNAKECGDLTVVPLGYVSQIVVEFLQHQREEMKKEILKIGEHFVKFGEKKGVEAIDMVLAVINPQQPGESKK